MTCVDWTKTLRRASWRGVPFWVQSDEMTYGRRLVVHEFPNRDRPFVEDLGEKAREYSVTAYVASNSAVSEMSALMSACRQRGPATLSLPTEGIIRARCKSAKRTHDRDKMGYIAFSLDFVEAGLGLGVGPFALLEIAVGTAAAAAIAAITSSFLSAYNTLRLADYVFSEAVSKVQGWAETIEAIRLGVKMDATASSDLGRSIMAYYTAAEVYAKDGEDFVAPNQSAFGVSSVQGQGGAVVQASYDLLEALRAGIVEDGDRVDALATLAEFSVDEPALITYSATGLQAENNKKALNSAYRQLALNSMAVAASEADWPTRNDAIYTRARVAELYEREMHNSSGGTEVFRSLSEVRNKATEAISRKIVDLDPVVSVESNVVMPSIVWAYRLYDDATQATDLIERNGIADPSFMPTTFSALVPISDERDDHVSDRRRRAGG